MTKYRWVKVYMSGNINYPRITIHREKETYHIGGSVASLNRILDLLENNRDKIEELNIADSKIEYCFPKEMRG